MFKGLRVGIIEFNDSEINIILSFTRLNIPNIQYSLQNSIGVKHRKQYYNIIIISTPYYPSMFMQIIPSSSHNTRVHLHIVFDIQIYLRSLYTRII